MKQATRGHTAVMARRVEPADSLDFFPSPPWSTRALMEHVLGRAALLAPAPYTAVWEPAAGEGHMAAVLTEYFPEVWATDCHDYGYCAVSDFLDPDNLFDLFKVPEVDWIITNPPFNRALDFHDRCVELWKAGKVRQGWAFLLRLAWLEADERWRVYRDTPPTLVCPFVERVAMIRGKWDPEASSATATAWFVWRPDAGGFGTTRLVHIPPGCKLALTRPDDRERFTTPADAPLFKGGIGEPARKIVGRPLGW